MVSGGGRFAIARGLRFRGHLNDIPPFIWDSGNGRDGVISPRRNRALVFGEGGDARSGARRAPILTPPWTRARQVGLGRIVKTPFLSP